MLHFFQINSALSYIKPFCLFDQNSTFSLWNLQREGTHKEWCGIRAEISRKVSRAFQAIQLNNSHRWFVSDLTFYSYWIQFPSGKLLILKFYLWIKEWVCWGTVSGIWIYLRLSNSSICWCLRFTPVSLFL